MIEISGLSKGYGSEKVIEGLKLHIGKGSIYGLVGVNGAGKTTLIKLMMGIIKADSGSITMDGQEIYENTQIKAQIGYIPDELFFFNAYSMKQMAVFLQSIYPDWDVERYRELVKCFGLDEHRKLSKFSKGMKKQAAITMVLSQRPRFLVLDEPIDGLDPLVRKKVWRLIMDDVYDREMSVLVSSHNLKELEGACDTIGIINRGRMIAERDLNDMKSGISKIQVSFKEGSHNELKDKIDVIYSEKRGSVELMVVKGKDEEVKKTIEAMNPVIFDCLPLTLEEIFIYEMGGDGYDIEEILF
jgi:ABC-2 type transport system ATP-binding protein